jgi:hypothetical protein
MMIRSIYGLGASALVAGALSFLAMQPAAAVTMTECSQMYKAAQKDGTLNGMKWNDFRKAKCGSSASAAPAAAPASTPAAAKTNAMAPTTPAPHATGAPANAVFPSAVSSKYSKESAGKARMHTCLDQYNANKASGGAGNGGLKWIQKGGGYYSLCNKRLKG